MAKFSLDELDQVAVVVDEVSRYKMSRIPETNYEFWADYEWVRDVAAALAARGMLSDPSTWKPYDA